jgi:hypothetical protein
MFLREDLGSLHAKFRSLLIEQVECCVRLVQQLFILGICRIVFLAKKSVPQGVYGRCAGFEIDAILLADLIQSIQFFLRSDLQNLGFHMYLTLATCLPEKPRSF